MGDSGLARPRRRRASLSWHSRESPQSKATPVTSQPDNHLRSEDFLKTEEFPTIDFVSTRIEPDGDDYKIHGDLTIRGVTRPVVLEAEYGGAIANMQGGQSAGFSATTKINREDFGLTWNVALEQGGLLVSRDIKIAIDLEVVSAPEQAEAQAETEAELEGATA